MAADAVALAAQDQDLSSGNTDALTPPTGFDTVMAEQTAHDVVKEAQSMGDASSIDVTAKPSNVAPAGNGKAQITSENFDAQQDLNADDTLQTVQTEVVGDTHVQTVSEVNLAAEPGDIPIDEGEIQTVVVDASGGSDTDTSKDIKDSPGGHVRSNSVKKPTSFKSVSVTKNFLAKTVATPTTKLSDKGNPSLDPQFDADLLTISSLGTPAGVLPSVAQQSARPRLVAKSALGGITRTAATNGTAPDASKVWNKNRRSLTPSPLKNVWLNQVATPPPPPRQFTDEELKQQYGIHMATRLQADEAGKESKWADIDDDEDDWAPETVEWMDGTKSSVVTADSQSTPPPSDGDKSAILKKTPSAGSSDQGTPASKPAVPASNKTILKPGVHLQNLVKSGSPAREGSEKSSPAVKPTALPAAKNPWAPLPPIDKVAPVFPQPPPQPPSALSPFRRDPHGFESLPPPPAGPAREIAADDFNRTWMDDRGPRELFDSKSGRYEPVGEMRRGSIRHEHGSRHPALLQRPSQMDRAAAPAEPSPAFQTRSTGADGGSWARRRASSNVSAGSGGRRFSIGRPQDERFDNMPSMRASAVESPQQQFAAIDTGLSPASMGQGSWPQSSPTFNTAHLPPGAQMSPFANGDLQGNQPGPPDEDPVARQQRLMREKQEATRLRKQREREEEAREEAARKERLRLKLASLGPATPSPELKEPKVKEAVVGVSPQQLVATTAISPPKPPIPTNEGEVAQYGVMKVHQPHPVKRGPGAGVASEGSLAKKLMPEAPLPSENQTSNLAVDPPGPALAGKRADSRTPLNSATWKSPSPSTAYNWGNNNSNSSNVWGPPQNNNRGLGNGTFNSDYNTIGGTIRQGPSSIERPGPIARPPPIKAFPPRSSLDQLQPSSTSTLEQAQLSDHPEHLIPSNLDNFDTPAINMGIDKRSSGSPPPAASTAAKYTVHDWKVAANGGLQSKMEEELRIAQAFRAAAKLNPTPMEDSQENLVTVWKKTKMEGSYGKRNYEEITETIHGETKEKAAIDTNSENKGTTIDSKNFNNQLAAPSMVTNPSQASNASAAHAGAPRGSRFFLNQEATFSTKSDSPPPPDSAVLFEDDDLAHPKVKFPMPKPLVKFPPTEAVNETVHVKTASTYAKSTPIATSTRRPESVVEGMINNLLNEHRKQLAAQVNSASKAPLDVASKGDAKVALPATSTKVDDEIADDTVETATKSMAEEELFEDREIGSLPTIRIPTTPAANAHLPIAPMKLLNDRPAQGRYVPVFQVDAESLSRIDLFAQKVEGGIATIYVKLPNDEHKLRIITYRAPPKAWDQYVSGNGNSNSHGNHKNGHHNHNQHGGSNNGRGRGGYRGRGGRRGGYNNGRGGKAVNGAATAAQ